MTLAHETRPPDQRHEGLRGMRPFRGYADGQERPLASYAVITLIYNSAVFLLCERAARRRTRPQPRLQAAADLLMFGIAAHKLSRLITKDFVTSFIRAPFTTYEGHGLAHAEVEERPRGRGLRRALGELLTCPYCVAQWVAPALWFGSIHRPGITRLAARVYTTIFIADVLHLAYVKATKQAMR